MNQDPKVLFLQHKSQSRKNVLTHKDAICFALQYMEQGNNDEAIKIFQAIPSSYWTEQFHKDISRALICHITAKTTGDQMLGKESEFYLVVYYLVKRITREKLNFKNSGYFQQLKDELFKGLWDGAQNI